MKIRLARELLYDSIVDGEGLRTVIWTQGCSHNCENCHNPETHDFTKGFLVDIEDIKEQLEERLDQDGITLSGGDPFFQPEPCSEIAKYAKEIGFNVWAYTGFTFEQLQKMAQVNQSINDMLENIDILVDGKFIQEQKSLNLHFKGSKNQRIIDVPESLKQNKVIEVEQYKHEKNYQRYQTKMVGVYV